MKETDYAGIDYSGPGSKVNRDEETGIRFGMISQNSLDRDALNDVYTEGDDLGFQCIKDEFVGDLRQAILRVAENYGRMDDDTVQQWAQDIVDGDGFEWHDCQESGPFSYNFDGYRLQTTSDNDLWVFRSPYFTHAQFCSPCVPGAGNLDTYCAEGPKTYCLGHDWFEEGKAPYPVYSVETGELVTA